MSKNPENEKNLWDEIYGCVNFLKMPYETVMNMPVYLRRFWINKHNESEAANNKNNKEKTSNVDGSMINSYAAMEQSNLTQKRLRNNH